MHTPYQQLIIYSPKEEFGGTKPCQKFTALGRVLDTITYQVEMAPNFTPWRRNVQFIPVTPTAIEPLLQTLSFTQGRTSWGLPFRLGFFEINEQDFLTIAHALEPKK